VSREVVRDPARVSAAAAVATVAAPVAAPVATAAQPERQARVVEDPEPAGRTRRRRSASMAG
jgi:hypothetical protein